MVVTKVRRSGVLGRHLMGVTQEGACRRSARCKGGSLCQSRMFVGGCPGSGYDDDHVVAVHTCHLAAEMPCVAAAVGDGGGGGGPCCSLGWSSSSCPSQARGRAVNQPRVRRYGCDDLCQRFSSRPRRIFDDASNVADYLKAHYTRREMCLTRSERP